MAATVMITGASRGIGLEFARAYGASGWQVIAAARNPDTANELRTLAKQQGNITIEKLDVTDPADIKRLSTAYQDASIDLLINNAGIQGPPPDRQALGSLDPGSFGDVIMTNTFAPLVVAEAFRRQVGASKQKKIIAISSGGGSLGGGMAVGGMYAYRASKTALNLVFKALRADLEADGIIVAVITPGFVDTDMYKSVTKDSPTHGAEANTPAVSVEGMIKAIDGMTLKNCAQFFRYDGTTMPW